MNLYAFYKWEVDFVGPIKPPGKRTGACCIITATYYLIRLVEAAPVKDCTATRFLFDHVVTQFGCPQILVSD